MSTSITIDRAVATFLKHCRGRVKRDTHDLYASRLSTWQRWRERQQYGSLLAEMTLDELLDFMVYLKDEHVPFSHHGHRPPANQIGLAPASRDAHWKTLRAFWNYAGQRRWLDPDQAEFFANGGVPRPKVVPQIRPTYDEASFERLISAADDPRHPERSARDVAFLLVVWESGMRIDETCSLIDEQIDHADRSATIVGKMDLPRFVFWTERAAAALHQYLLLRLGPQGGPLFRSTGSRSSGQRFTDDAARARIGRIADRAGVVLPRGAPIHAMRHTFAHRALDAGADISEVSQYLGHTDVETTMIYLRQRKAVQRRRHDELFGSQRRKR